MQTVHTLEAAKEFFLANAEGEVTVQNEHGLTKVVSSFPEAEQFFSETAERAEEAEVANAQGTIAGATAAAEDADVEAKVDGPEGSENIPSGNNSLKDQASVGGQVA